MVDFASESISASEARQTFATLVNRVNREHRRVIVEKSGIPVAALVTIEDLERLRQLDRDRAARHAFLESMREPFKDVPTEELEREIERALAEVRSEMRAERAAALSGS